MGGLWGYWVSELGEIVIVLHPEARICRASYDVRIKARGARKFVRLDGEPDGRRYRGELVVREVNCRHGPDYSRRVIAMGALRARTVPRRAARCQPRIGLSCDQFQFQLLTDRFRSLAQRRNAHVIVVWVKHTVDLRP